MSEERESAGVEIRPISNGFIARHTHSGPEGYHSTEVFHPKKPKLELSPQGAQSRAEAKRPTNALAEAARHIERARPRGRK